MAAFGHPTLVEGPAPTLYQYGLFSAVNFRDGSTDRWEMGIIWEPTACMGDLPVGGIGQIQCPPAGTVGLPVEFERTHGDTESATPFTATGTYTCSPIGNPLGRAQERATQNLILTEEHQAEQAILTGDLGNVPNFEGANGSITPTDLGAHGYPEAVATLEQFLAETYGVGVIHVDKETAVMLLSEGVARVKGGRLETDLGTQIVAYSVSLGGRLYSTSQLLGYRSEIFASTDDDSQNLDTKQNNLKGLAMRNYVLGFDPCGFGVVQIDPDAGAGREGPPGPPGEGVPAGGAEGEVLTKSSAEDYSTEWASPPVNPEE